MTTTKPFTLGSVSTGTLWTEDLLPAFHEAVSAIVRHRWGVEPGTPQEQVDELTEVLQSLCPPFVYFGAHPGDGADFGFWPDWDAIQELDLQYHFFVSFVSGEERIYFEDGVIIAVDDSGNTTVMDLERHILWTTGGPGAGRSFMDKPCASDGHSYPMKADGVTRQMDRSCGAYVCLECDDHEGLARCYCGWARDGGDGVRQLQALGENVEDDY